MTTGLECREVTFRHAGPDAPVLQAATAQFLPGAVTWVSGPTGAGKSTLLHLLAGLMRPTAGEIRADGAPVSRWRGPHRDRWRRQVGIVFQHHRLLAGLSALENVMLPLVARGFAPAAMRRAARQALEDQGLLSRADRAVRELSGGQKQRVALARALAVAPRFVLADEPAAHQDRRGAALVLQALRRAADEGAVVVVAAHDSPWAGAAAGDRRLYLAGGVLGAAP